jgi:hypothetical protein
MDRLRLRVLPVIALVLALPWFACAAALPREPEIAALIGKVEQARGVTFIRNGSDHSAGEAAAHLRRKLAAAHGRITTADQFIDAVGTRSSMTGIAYRVRLPDGREIDSATWLRQLLRELRVERVRSPRPAASIVPVPAPARR